MRPVEDQVRKVNEAAKTRINALDSGELSPDDLDKKMGDITTETAKKLEILNKQLADIRDRFTTK